MADQSFDISSPDMPAGVILICSTWSARSEAVNAWKAGGNAALRFIDARRFLVTLAADL